MTLIRDDLFCAGWTTWGVVYSSVLVRATGYLAGVDTPFFTLAVMKYFVPWRALPSINAAYVPKPFLLVRCTV